VEFISAWLDFMSMVSWSDPPAESAEWLPGQVIARLIRERDMVKAQNQQLQAGFNFLGRHQLCRIWLDNHTMGNTWGHGACGRKETAHPQKVVQKAGFSGVA